VADKEDKNKNFLKGPSPIIPSLVKEAAFPAASLSFKVFI
jgi:hypothetical protein